ncbi:unnamed protein product [Jaminaea pallidilutea]
MVFANFASLVTIAAASLAAAAPTQKRAAPGQSNIDTVILNYALTLEHLEAAFYRDSLNMLSANDFEKAGFQPWIRQRFIEIGGQEQQHVAFLTKALGDKAVKECKYDFGVTDVNSFIATSQLLEGVGVSAYLGAAANITSTDYLTAAGSILTTEARHSAWVQSSAALSDPAGAPYDVPLDFNQTYSLAAPLIKSCPDSNAKLPVSAFPALTLSPNKSLKPGEKVKVSGKGVNDGQYLAAITAGSTLFSQIQNGHAQVPEGVQTGRTYYLVTKGKSVSDDSTVAGPVASDYLLSAAEAASKVDNIKQ